jgi:hypothetical protein
MSTIALFSQDSGMAWFATTLRSVAVVPPASLRVLEMQDLKVEDVVACLEALKPQQMQ